MAELREIELGQCNNAFIFPGMGLGALGAEPREDVQRFAVRADEAEVLL